MLEIKDTEPSDYESEISLSESIALVAVLSQVLIEVLVVMTFVVKQLVL
jgi:hypothetical protein